MGDESLPQAPGVHNEVLRQDLAQRALAGAVERLLALQSPGGWWRGEVETNVSIDAQDVLLRELLGIRTPALTDASARRIRSRQQGDGTWSLYHRGPPHLSTTIEAYLALRLGGDPVDAPHMAKAAAFVSDAGGIKASLWVALFGLRSWDDLPVIPPELVFLPPWFPLNLYDWAGWTRLILVPAAIIGSQRTTRTLPFDVDELRGQRDAPRRIPPVSWARVFDGLDRALHRYERRPNARMRRAAQRRCADWLLARQSTDGTWGGTTTYTTLALIALHLVGYELDNPVMERGLRGLERFVVDEPTPDGPSRRVDVTQSPHWDTALAMVALRDAGMRPDHPALVGGAEWILAQEVRGAGDWQVHRPRGRPGGWSFQFSNEHYPDIDDTAAAVLALQTVDRRHHGQHLEDAVARAVGWLETMQCGDGGWGAFDADNTRKLCGRLPIVGFGGAIDPPSADVTARAIKALCGEGRAASRAVRRGVRWLLDAQEPEGSWLGRWGVNHVYGTGLVLPALIAAGLDVEDAPIRRAVAWLEGHQNDDGGWGEDPRSYSDATLRGRGASTPSQTAWALLGLLAARPRSSAVDGGIIWLLEQQRPDGNWDEPQFTGTMFPEHIHSRYELYRLTFPISALGRYTQL